MAGGLCENWRVDCAADLERKRQKTILYGGPCKARECARKKSLLGGDPRDALVVQLIRAVHVYRSGGVHVYAIPVDIDGLAADPKIGQLQIGGDAIERSGIIFGGSLLVELHEAHQIFVERQAGNTPIVQRHMSLPVNTRERPVCVQDL